MIQLRESYQEDVQLKKSVNLWTEEHHHEKKIRCNETAHGNQGSLSNFLSDPNKLPVSTRAYDSPEALS